LATTPQNSQADYLVTVVVYWPQPIFQLGQQLFQGQVFLSDQNAGFRNQIGVVKQGGETTLTYTLKASAGDDISSWMTTNEGPLWFSERIKLGNTNPILHIKATHRCYCNCGYILIQYCAKIFWKVPH
jgi:hypothetical protein